MTNYIYIIHVEGCSVAPFMVGASPKAIDFLDNLWKLSGHTYIVDPVGCSQANVIEYYELPEYMKWIFQIRYGKVLEVKITKLQYEEEKYKYLSNYE